MRVLIIDKTAGLETSHERHQAIASQPGIDLTVLGPRHWIENGRDVLWLPRVDCRYTPIPGFAIGQGYYARVTYIRGLIRALLTSQPEVIQLLEEPWSFSTAQTILLAGFFAPHARLYFYTWENREQGWDYPSRGAMLYRWIDKTAHIHSRGALCATPVAERVLQNKGYPHETAVIPYGVPRRNFIHHSKWSSPQTFTIGYIGRFLSMKGVDLLIRSLPHLPNARLLLIGSGDDEQAFRSLAEELGVASRIEWRGMVDEYTIPHTLREMNVLVLPSRTTSSWQEQLGRVLIEAMAAGVPVIGSTSGAIPDVIQDAGLLFTEDDVAHLTQQLQWIQSSPDFAHEMALRGQARAYERFTWDRFAYALSAFWQRNTEP